MADAGKVTQALSMGFNAMNTSVRAYVPKLITSADVTAGIAKAVAAAVQAPVTAAAASACQRHARPRRCQIVKREEKRFAQRANDLL